ncbi:MAG: hypothetical protein JNM78_18260 [Cyclobacteriaceae bacterium]|nr:hypothetical protein [Cyclobacteriaceae bacterium]
MTDTTKNKKPYVNPSLERLTNIIIIASILTIFIIIVLSWTSEKHLESLTNFGIMILAIIVGAVAYNFKNNLTKKRNEWEYKQTIKIIEGKELRLDDRFMFTRVYRNADTLETYLYHYLISNGTLYQVNSYEDEKYDKDYLGIGSVIKAKIIEEDEQLKIIEYTAVNKVPQVFRPNNHYKATGIISEKYFGYSPNGIKDQTTADFPNMIVDPRFKLEMAQTIHLKFDGVGLYSMKKGDKDKFFLRINRYFEQVSMEDFLQHKIGDIITFTRNETTGISSIIR